MNLFLSFQLLWSLLYVRIMCIFAIVTKPALPLAVVPAYLLSVDHLHVVFAWNLTVIAYVLDDCMSNWLQSFPIVNNEDIMILSVI